jgi:hypothetical protein
VPQHDGRSTVGTTEDDERGWSLAARLAWMILDPTAGRFALASSRRDAIVGREHTHVD